MPLINFQTDLTSLPWGRDRRESGDSNQPYITQDIPEGITYDDMPGRGIGDEFFTTTGFLRPRSALRDVSRLTQMFFDFKSPRGLLFVAKENILSRTSVKTQAGGPGYGGFTPGNEGNAFTAEGDILKLGGGGGVNQGIYLPTSTILQALGPIAGGHLNLLGIDPTNPLSGPGGISGDGLSGLLGDTNLGLMTYSSRANQRSNADGFQDKNRLIQLTNFHVNQPLEFAQQTDLAGDPAIDEFGDPVEALENTIRPNLYSYSGGPGSILGIGNTNLMFASERTGFENRLAASNNGYFFQGGLRNRSYQIDPNQSKLYYDLSYVNNSATAMYGQRILSKIFRRQSQRQFLFNDTFSTPGLAAIAIGPNGPYQTFPTQVSGLITELDDDGVPSQVFKTNPQILYKNGSRTYDQLQLISKDGVIQGDGLGLYPQDFRRQLYTASTEFVPAPTEDPDNPLVGGTQQSTVLSVSPNYRTKNIDVRLNMGQPGLQGGAKRDEAAIAAKNVWNYGVPANELEALDKLTAMPMYSGTGPDINQPINDLCKFRIAAINNNKTDGEAVYMHFRAFLDSFNDAYTAEWSGINYVGRGDTLHSYGGFGRTISLGFTVAAQSKAELIPMYKKLNYLASTLAPDYSQAGFMRGNLVRLTVGGYLYEQPGFITSLTYDIPQEAPWEIGMMPDGGSDSSVKELPHIIKVSGFNFTPIHTFLPQKPGDANNPSSKFIALSNGVGNNYVDEYLPYQPTAESGGDGDNNVVTT